MHSVKNGLGFLRQCLCLVAAYHATPQLSVPRVLLQLALQSSGDDDTENLYLCVVGECLELTAHSCDIKY